MTDISLRKAKPGSVKADALVVGVHSDDNAVVFAAGAESLSAAVGRKPAATLKQLGVSTKPGSVTKILGGDKLTADVVAIVGLGPVGSSDDETLRTAAGAAARSLAGSATVAVSLPTETDAQVRAVAEGLLLGRYAYDRYLASKPDPVGEFIVITDRARSSAAKSAVEEAQTVSAAVNFARDLVNTPANDLYPESFADQARERAGAAKVAVTVLDDKQLEAGGYGGMMGVGKGSARPPRLMKLTYRPRKASAHLAFVGKGITFDSGGLSIKPGSSMKTMKCDMSGAAAVTAAICAIAELGLPVRVTAYACLAENMPSGTASRPGDVLTMYGGKTVEVLNTDAEGRLVLADGITSASEEKPDLIVDVATLTGACVVALGSRTSGVFANDDELLDEMPAVARRAGEQMWPLPITDEIVEKVKESKIADLAQISSEPYGGALFAAAFLREFVGDGLDWVHLDIAGAAFNNGEPYGYTPAGGTGTAVRTLVQLARERVAG